MKKLNKYPLQFKPAKEYIVGELEDVNILSIQLLKLLDFDSGKFFVLLPDNANLEELYNFKCGGILPQFPEEKQIFNGKVSTFSWIPDINKELAELILSTINSIDNLYCVFDDVSGPPNDALYIYFSEAHPVCYDEDVYFLLDQYNISQEMILKCMKASTSFWHSLAIITKANLNNVGKLFTLEQIKEICLKTELIMVGAYDGEGYVFWEKSPIQGNLGFFE